MPESGSLLEITIDDIRSSLEQNVFTSVDLVRACIARIDETKELNAILQVNEDAIRIAEELDSERLSGRVRGALHGIPILIKDNIGSADSMQTSAGSFCLLDARPARDATVISYLRESGAILLGKTNMSEWANYRSSGPKSSDGWSPRGGQTYGAYHKHQNPCGSSSGSAVAVSIGLSVASVGTETDGSIVCPSSRNNVVGIKPTVGLTARDGVIPTSRRQDTVGPFARTVKDAAIMLSAMAGPSKFDQATEKIPFKSIPNYAAACRGADLKRFRIGVPQDALEGLAGDILVVFEKATSVFKSRGAEVMTNVNLNCLAEFKAIDTENVLLRDFSTALSGYLTRLPTNPQKVYSFNDVIEFTKQDPREDCPGYGIEKFRKAFQSPQEDSDEYQNNLRRAINLATSYGALGALKRWKLDAIILPSSASSATSLAAIVGMPIVAIPMGYYPDETALQTSKKGDTFRAGPKFPIGMQIIGNHFEEEKLISIAFAFEQSTNIRAQVKPVVLPKTELYDVQHGTGLAKKKPENPHVL